MFVCVLKKIVYMVGLLVIVPFSLQAEPKQPKRAENKQIDQASAQTKQDAVGKEEKSKDEKSRDEKGKDEKGKDEKGKDEKDKGDKDDGTKSWLMLIYVLCVVVPLLAIHLYDSYKAYGGSRLIKRVLRNLQKNASPQEMVNLIRELRSLQSRPIGISGTTRSIFSYMLLLILAIAVFHLLTISSDSESLAVADKTIAVLSGAVATIIGFYFGAKATAEAPKSQPEAPAPTPPGQISSITPASAPVGSKIAIKGKGFGDERGSVKFGNLSAQDNEIDQWSDTCVTVKVPQTCPPGKVVVCVNPTQGKAVSFSEDGFEVTTSSLSA